MIQKKTGKRIRGPQSKGDNQKTAKKMRVINVLNVQLKSRDCQIVKNNSNNQDPILHSLQ